MFRLALSYYWLASFQRLSRQMTGCRLRSEKAPRVDSRASRQPKRIGGIWWLVSATTMLHVLHEHWQFAHSITARRAVERQERRNTMKHTHTHIYIYI